MIESKYRDALLAMADAMDGRWAIGFVALRRLAQNSGLVAGHRLRNLT